MQHFFLVLLCLFISFTSHSQNSSGENLRQVGIKYKNTGLLDSSRYYLKRAYEVFKLNGDSTGLGNVYNNLGSLEQRAGNYVLAISNYNEAIRLFSSINEIRGLTKVQINLAGLFYIKGEIESSYEYYIKAGISAEKVADLNLRAPVLTGLANIYSNQNSVFFNLNKAMDLYIEAISIYDSASEEINLATTYNNLGAVYSEMGRQDLAYAAFEKYYSYGLKLGDKQLQVSALRNIGKQLMKDKRLPEAYEKTILAYKIASQIKDPENMVDILANLTLLKMSFGEVDSAQYYFLNYRNLKDSLNDEEKQEHFTELQVQYDSENKQLLLEQQKFISETRAQYILWLSLVSGLLLLAIMILIWTYRRRRIAERERLRKDFEISVLKAQIDGQNSERNRIASDLHDGVGSLLTSIRMMHSTYVRNAGPVASRADAMLNELADEVRKVSHNLSSLTLQRNGLEDSLHEYVNYVEEINSITIDLIFNVDTKDIAIELVETIDYTVKELINNTIKHANAEFINIQFTTLANTLIMTYEDDGTGFNMKETRYGLGLDSMMNRIKNVEGSITIDSKIGEGIMVSIEIPCTVA